MLYPIITKTRGQIDLNGLWNFKLDNGDGHTEKWFKKPLENTSLMAVPSSYNDIAIEKKIRNHVGWVWYEKEFTVLYVR